MDEKKGVLLFPAYKGNGAAQVSSELVKLAVDFVLVPILNGLPLNELAEISRGLLPIFEPIVTGYSPRGLVDVLSTGYDYVIKNHPGLPVVRMDIDEHPISFVNELLREVLENRGMVIGDLSFDGNVTIVDEVDAFVHKELFPLMYAGLTSDQLSLSCAHGFQLFCNTGICSTILEGARSIILAAEDDYLASIRWGLDAAMALAATALGLNVKVVKIPAIVERKRTREKAMEQLKNHLLILKAAARIFPNL